MLQLYTVELPLAVRFTALPIQTELEAGLTIMFGRGFTKTVMIVLAEQPEGSAPKSE